MTRDVSSENVTRQFSFVYKPRLAIQIIFPTSSPTILSNVGVNNLPTGGNVEGALVGVGTTSQQVYPEDGRSTIGGLSVDILDSEYVAGYGTGPNLTQELRDALNSGYGARDREVRLFIGYNNDWNDYDQVGTFYVDNVDYKEGIYSLTCRDKSKFIRDNIFAPKTVRAGAAIGVDDTTITTQTTIVAAGFETLNTDAGWTDGPNGTYGWLRIKSSGEIIRYTGISGTTFTGCSRGRFRTRPMAIEYDGNDPEELEEFIYLEGPAIKIAYMVLTGVINPGESPLNHLPSHWNAGVAESDLEGWDTIGEDLYNPNDVTAGFPARFTYLEEVETKTFLEQEIYRLTGTYAAVMPYGTIRLKRVNRVVNAATAFRINDTICLKYGALKNDMRAVRNNFAIDWNYDGEDLTRRLLLLDAGSINKHGKAKQVVLPFRGLHTARHTQGAILNIMATLRDRYAEPPLRLSVQAPWYYNRLEIGDLVRVELSTLRDFTDVDAADEATLDRVFEVQKTSMDWGRGVLSLDVFASTREIPSPVFNPDTAAVLASDWYDGSTYSPAIGTDISGLGGYSGSTLTGYTFNGHASNINDSSAIFYHDGDLTLDACFLNDNVQLRVRGTLTIVGTLDGVGGGYAGGVDSDALSSASTGWYKAGNDGFLGPIRGGSGLYYFGNVSVAEIEALTAGTWGSVPFLALNVDENDYLTTQFPNDLKGSGGPTGAQVIAGPTANWGVGGTVIALPGDGGDGGAGLAIVSRGLAYGVNGKIDLSGTAGGAPGKTGSVYDVQMKTDNVYLQAGGGASGTPGGMIVLLDGDLVPYPDITSSTLVATIYAVPDLDAIPPRNAVVYPSSAGLPVLQWNSGDFNVSPFPSARGFDLNAQQVTENVWRSAHVVQYIPDTTGLGEDETPAPQSLTITSGNDVVFLQFNRASAAIAKTEVFCSSVNDRAFAEFIGSSATGEITITQAGGPICYYWIRNVGLDDATSDWYPSIATAGQQAQAVSGYVHIADPFMNNKESWLYQSGSPLTDITGLTYVENIDIGFGADVNVWQFEEGNSNIDLYAQKRIGPAEFDAFQTYGASPSSDDQLLVDVTITWRRVGGTWTGGTGLYLLTEWYSTDDTTVDNDTGGVDATLLINPHLAPDGEWQVTHRTKMVVAVSSPLGAASPIPPEPHSLRHFLRVGTGTSTPSPLGYIQVASLVIVPSS